jgi:hypothetical protein
MAISYCGLGISDFGNMENTFTLYKVAFEMQRDYEFEKNSF